MENNDDTLFENENIEKTKKSVLIVSKETYFIDKMKKFLEDFNDFEYNIQNDISKFVELSQDKIIPYLFLVDGNLGQPAVAEWAQTLKMSFPKIPLIVFHTNKVPLNFEILKKNGTNHIIHINYDKEFVIDLLLEVIPYDFQGNNIPIVALNVISYKDISPELDLNFDVFFHLPNNHKTILYRKKGTRLDEAKIKKLEETHQKIYFKKTEKKDFFEYARTAQTFSNIERPVALTEKSLKTKKLIFLIMGEFFNQEVNDFKAGRNIFDRCKEILQEYRLLDDYSPRESYLEMVKFTGEVRTFYSDAINLCIYSAHIGNIVGFNKEKIESLALAGLLHNIGLSYIDNIDVNMSPSELSSSDESIYYTYPDKSVLMIKGKKVPLPPDVSDTILEHRVNLDGSGFPKKKIGEKVQSLSKIIRVAYEFQALTCYQQEQINKNPALVVEEMKEKAISNKLPIDLNTILALAKCTKGPSERS